MLIACMQGSADFMRVPIKGTIEIKAGAEASAECKGLCQFEATAVANDGLPVPEEGLLGRAKKMMASGSAKAGATFDAVFTADTPYLGVGTSHTHSGAHGWF